MFDDLRDTPEETDFLDEDYESPYEETERTSRRRGRFLGLTSAQRLVLAILLLGTVVVIGILFLLVTGKVAWVP